MLATKDGILWAAGSKRRTPVIYPGARQGILFGSPGSPLLPAIHFAPGVALALDGGLVFYGLGNFESFYLINSQSDPRSLPSFWITSQANRNAGPHAVRTARPVLCPHCMTPREWGTTRC